ncbi:putative NRPS-like protein biosynthetic cluster [Aspergillus melleus]|uniref:NRPS-like protein biosynthetic cluster n=1 Tax=Aspergillus melleus TaxID=138277 RepID=A0ACC3B8U1_9EURO|nr:putative NRPS-like protein biosynthetic cluster [Aspergillus melleus]
MLPTGVQALHLPSRMEEMILSTVSDPLNRSYIEIYHSHTRYPVDAVRLNDAVHRIASNHAILRSIIVSGGAKGSTEMHIVVLNPEYVRQRAQLLAIMPSTNPKNTHIIAFEFHDLAALEVGGWNGSMPWTLLDTITDRASRPRRVVYHYQLPSLADGWMVSPRTVGLALLPQIRTFRLGDEDSLGPRAQSRSSRDISHALSVGELKSLVPTSSEQIQVCLVCQTNESYPSNVPICFDKSLEMVVTILALLKAGTAYVPLDPSHPEERLEAILRTCKASLVLWGSLEYSAALVATCSSFLISDASIGDLFANLWQGGRLALVPRNMMLSNLNHWLEETCSTHIALTPTVGNLILPNIPAHLKTFMFGGEAFHRSFLTQVPSEAKVWNTCGPTETVVDVACYVLSPTKTKGTPIGQTGEVEAVIKQSSTALTQVCVDIHQYVSGQDSLVAQLVPIGGQETESVRRSWKQDVLVACQHRLARYMIPSVWILVSKVLLTTSAKLDRWALRTW